MPQNTSVEIVPEQLPYSLCPYKKVGYDTKYTREEMIEIANKSSNPDKKLRRLMTQRWLVGVEKTETVPDLAPGIPKPRFQLERIETTSLRKTIRGRLLAAVLTTEELALYVEFWNKLWIAHKDEYDQPEDELDVHRICQEAVNQFRMERARAMNPADFDGDAYNQSCSRMDNARTNLAARRTDRISSKNKGGTNVTIAIAAGMFDEQAMRQRQERAIQQEADEKGFLDRTSDQQPKALLPGHTIVDGVAVKVTESESK